LVKLLESANLGKNLRRDAGGNIQANEHGQLVYTGDLYLDRGSALNPNGDALDSLPPLEISGSLYLNAIDFSQRPSFLPASLTVHTDCDLSNTGVTVANLAACRLIVDNDLFLYGSDLTSVINKVPTNVQVGGYTNLDNPSAHEQARSAGTTVAPDDKDSAPHATADPGGEESMGWGTESP